MKKHIVIAMVLISFMAAAPLAAQGGKEAAPAPVQTYTFGGSSTVAPIANSALTAFLADKPNLKISYETLGSSTGIKQLQEGTLSLAGSERECSHC